MSQTLCTSAVKNDQARAGQDSVEDAATVGADPSTAAADEPKDTTAASTSSGASDLPIQLSAMRKADVSPFKGTVYVSLAWLLALSSSCLVSRLTLRLLCYVYIILVFQHMITNSQYKGEITCMSWS